MSRPPRDHSLPPVQQSRRVVHAAALWLGAAIVLWGHIVGERVFELPDRPSRAVLIGGLFLVLVGGALAAAWRLARSRWRLLPWLFFAAVAAREGRRVVLSERYRGSSAVLSAGPVESLWSPVTTSALVTRTYRIPAPELAVPRLRAVELTDLHFAPTPSSDYFDEVFRRVESLQPDVLLLTGDYVSDASHFELFAHYLARRLPARFGTFAVLGNHDHWLDANRVQAMLEAAGVTLVAGRCEPLPRALGPVAICGTDAPWGVGLDRPLPRASLNLVLSHTPDNIFPLAERGASAVFAGHTHGGQLRLPGIGAVLVPSRYGRLFDQGHFQIGTTELFVSPGIGADSPPLRIYCRPEILVVDFFAR